MRTRLWIIPVLCTLATLLVPGQSAGQTTLTAQSTMKFLSIGVGARPAGMGDSFISNGDDIEHVLHALERKEFVRRDRRSAIAGETQYAFLHAQVRDVGYGQIPRSDRADKHRLAAEWLASLAGAAPLRVTN